MNLLKKFSKNISDFNDSAINESDLLNVRGGNWVNATASAGTSNILSDIPPKICVNLLNASEIIDLKIAIVNKDDLSGFYNMDLEEVVIEEVTNIEDDFLDI